MVRLFISFSLFLALPVAAYAADEVGGLCAHVRVEAAEKLSFTPIERKLVCGDPRDPPWRTVPRNQARYMLGTFLQGRGYYHYQFRDEAEALVAVAGEPTVINEVDGSGLPAAIDLTRYWLPRGKPLTPKLLDDIEGWVRSRLKAEGYACPKVQTSANPETGRILVTADPGPRQAVKAVEEENVPHLVDKVLRRYDAFGVGEIYDDEAVQLTVRRTLGKQLLLSTHFVTICEPDGVVLHQKSLAGPPRLASVGFGFNTEEFLQVKGSLRNSRLGPTGSVLDLTTKASYRTQEISASAEWYVLAHASRFYLKPEISFVREYEPLYESRSTRASFAPAITYDAPSLGVGGNLWMGPALTLFRTMKDRREDAPPYARIASVDGQADVQSYLHEYYAASPRTGFMTSANWSIAVKEGSTVAAHRFSASGRWLHNIASWDPPRLVAGLRAGYATTITGGSDEEFQALPPSYLRYLGGSQNVRGFGRRSLPSNDGALTTMYSGAELRLTSVIPYNIEPLIFTDVGLTGREARYLDPPYYVSPGFGGRWGSPIGPMRLTFGKGYVRGKDAKAQTGHEGWAFYFSFGEEF